MQEDDFIPFQPPTSADASEKTAAMEYLRPLEKNMSYDSVRGRFQILGFDADKSLQVIDALKTLGGRGVTSFLSDGKANVVVVIKDQSTEVAEILKTAGFNFVGAKDVPSTQRSA